MSFGEKIWKSLFSSDIYILIAFIFAIALLIATLHCNKKVKNELSEWEKERNLRLSSNVFKGFTISYTLFITAISIFPLLGMFGTVKALLELDLSNISSAKNNFFDALTSTTWGIIFAVLFKLINACIATQVENNIKKLEDLIKKFENSGIIIDSKKDNKKRRVKK